MDASSHLDRPSVGLTRGAAMTFVILLGLVSLFADVTYEGARSITGPYLAVLGASATVVGVVAGFGELIGYVLRLVAGYLSDRTGRYWTFTLIGYVVNLLAVPFLALAGRWELAAALIVAERFGKAIRTPARDAMLSHATTEIGRGWGFGLHEAMDQIGALLGPLIVAAVLFRHQGYASAFGVLLIPALLALGVLVGAKLLYPDPRAFEIGTPPMQTQGFPRVFWVYLVAIGLIAAGYADFPLIAYHLQKTSLASEGWIPLFYAVAMGVDAVAALICGRLFDRLGFTVLGGVALVSALFAPLVFLGHFHVAMLGMVCGVLGWARKSRSCGLPSPGWCLRRGTAYGVFNSGYGLLWFAGSALMGVLYDVSLPTLIAFSMGAQLLAVPVLFRVGRQRGA